MTLIGRRALLAAGLAMPLAALPSAAGAALLPPKKEAPPRVKPLGTIWLADRKPTVAPGDEITLGLWVRPAADVADAVFRYWRTSCWFPIARTEVPLGSLAAAGPIELPITIPIPPDQQLLKWSQFKRKGVDWWRATLKSDGRLNNGVCTPGGVLDTGAGCPPGGICKIGVSISCEVADRGFSRRSTQFRFTLTIAAVAPG